MTTYRDLDKPPRLWECENGIFDLEHVVCVTRAYVERFENEDGERENVNRSATVYLAGDEEPWELEDDEAESLIAAWKAYRGVGASKP